MLLERIHDGPPAQVNTAAVPIDVRFRFPEVAHPSCCPRSRGRTGVPFPMRATTKPPSPRAVTKQTPATEVEPAF